MISILKLGPSLERSTMHEVNRRYYVHVEAGGLAEDLSSDRKLNKTISTVQKETHLL